MTGLWGAIGRGTEMRWPQEPGLALLSHLLYPARITPGSQRTWEGSVNGIFLSVRKTSRAIMEGKGREC